MTLFTAFVLVLELEFFFNQSASGFQHILFSAKGSPPMERIHLFILSGVVQWLIVSRKEIGEEFA